MQLSAVARGLWCLTSAVLADAALEAWKAQMERLLAQLEGRVGEQDETLRAKDRQSAELQRQAGEQPGTGDRKQGQAWWQRIEVGGLVEVETVHHSPYAGSSGSDLTIATVEIGVAAQVNDGVDGELVLSYEEDDTPLEVDVAVVTVSPPNAPWLPAASMCRLAAIRRT